jgi:DNA repair exonuclease SbcCD ATPase subunit
VLLIAINVIDKINGEKKRMKELIKKIKEFEKKSGLKLYEDIMNDLVKISMKIEDLKKSRENWKEKYMEVKKNEL